MGSPFRWPGSGGGGDSSVYQQLGEITATLQAFREDLVELRTAVGKVAQAQNASATDRSAQNRVVITRIGAIERTTSEQHKDNTAKLQAITDELAAMREPVSQFVSMRKRLSRLAALAFAGAAMAWALAQPVYNFIVARLFGPH